MGLFCADPFVVDLVFPVLACFCILYQLGFVLVLPILIESGFHVISSSLYV
jgi:hypothetical protein